MKRLALDDMTSSSQKTEILRLSHRSVNVGHIEKQTTALRFRIACLFASVCKVQRCRTNPMCISVTVPVQGVCGVDGSCGFACVSAGKWS